MIKIINATKKLGNIIAINNLNLEFENGIFGIVGHNGAGKSTLFRLISDIYELDAGEILIDGELNNKKEVKSKIFFLTDNPFYPSGSNIKDVYYFYSSLYEIDKDKFYNLIDFLKLPLNKKVSTFSKGMQRQMFLALALSINTKIYLLDEAFDGIDINSILKFNNIIKQLLEEDNTRTVLIASHNLSILENIATSFVIIKNGMLVNNDIKTSSSRYIKYHMLLDIVVSNEELKSIIPEIVNYNLVGSIIEVILNKDIDIYPILTQHYKVILCEKIPLENNEIIKLEMFEEDNKDE